MNQNTTSYLNVNKCSQDDSLKMILLLVLLFLLHQGYALVPVITVHVGEATTVTCDLPSDEYRGGKLLWYRQTVGHTLELIGTFWKYANLNYGPSYSDSRMTIVVTDKMSNLTILKTVQEDEGMYHCAFPDWSQTVWRGTYLLIKGNTVGTLNYRVVQSLTASDSVRAEEYVTLQCSVLSDFDRTTCSEDLSVFWFRSNTPDPHIMFIDGNKTDRCQKKTDYQTRCVYNFSKDISSSDAGTYYCAVATCGEILFGNATKLEAESTADGEIPVQVITISCLIISLIINIVFICFKTPRAACKQSEAIEGTSSQEISMNLSQQDDHTNENGKDLNYAALHFSAGKARRGKKINVKEDSVYSYIKP
ncbi:uncharacterized protein LOC118557502 [Fundulus heteroclitus]|uniref:uncharacterized protein LOC118557502 n=1 Tax=Fundulus heteroclitus TaxID=8078 RepID=UPI00165CD6A3|nr:uncharacterized protein LOC118557502 [Fundulus heteroclitus]